MTRWSCLAILIIAISCVSGVAEAHSAQKHHLHHQLHGRHHELWAWYRNSGARCVHRYEGSWTDPNPAYFGGFQMDRAFMRYWAPGRYRVAGTANHWTPVHQVAVVRRAVHHIGWGPWPTTAALCGLL